MTIIIGGKIGRAVRGLWGKAFIRELGSKVSGWTLFNPSFYSLNIYWSLPKRLDTTLDITDLAANKAVTGSAYENFTA